MMSTIDEYPAMNRETNLINRSSVERIDSE